MLAFLSSAIGEWDLVFLDPPYDDPVDHALAGLVPHLAPDAVVVLERSTRTPPPALPDGLVLDRRKDYGDTAVYWLEPA